MYCTQNKYGVKLQNRFSTEKRWGFVSVLLHWVLYILQKAKLATHMYREQHLELTLLLLLLPAPLYRDRVRKRNTHTVNTILFSHHTNMTQHNTTFPLAMFHRYGI